MLFAGVANCCVQLYTAAHKWVLTHGSCQGRRIARQRSEEAELTMQTIETEVLYRPESASLKFLPEGPYSVSPEMLSWVAIQHGATAVTGSINLLNTADGRNRTFDLPGRPGFAFPTDRDSVFVAGVEREVGLFDIAAGRWTPFIRDVDQAVTNTIINDGVVFEDLLIFGCKDLEFGTRKAGLYLWRSSDQQLRQLRNDQICSNGKAVVRHSADELQLFDIDSPSKLICRMSLDPVAGTVGEPRVIVDLNAEEVFPDGMILTPDHQSLIVALYDPGDPKHGAARQYRLSDGALQAEWICPGSPRVTCPQLISHEGRVRLLLTTAVEHMSPEQQQRHVNAGCLFVGDTPFDSIGDQPVFHCPPGI